MAVKSLGYGEKGSRGDAGPIGPSGAKGDTGAVGPSGAVGQQGPQGATGAMGPQGVKGDTGAVGPKGDTGAVGATGPQGAQGPIGATGPAGSNATATPLGTAAPKALAATAAPGTSASAAREDHVHPLPSGRVEFVGNVTVSDTALISLALGMKRMGVTLAGIASTDRLTFSPAGVPTTGVEAVNVYASSNNQVTVSYFTPALGIGASYAIPLAIYRFV